MFTNKEIEESLKCPHLDRIHAALFTIKESILKALGCGLKRGSFWHDMNIDRNLCASITGSLLELWRKRSIKKVHISVACTREYALGITLTETDE